MKNPITLFITPENEGFLADGSPYVTSKVISRWKKLFGDRNHVDMYKVIGCSKNSCKMTHDMPCDNPAMMRFAEMYAVNCKWYCHHHKLAAWETERALTSNLFPALMKLQNSPGCNKSKLPCKQGDIDFLLAIGLITVNEIYRGEVKKVYEIYLTKLAQKYIEDHVAEISDYMIHYENSRVFYYGYSC
jgi:hypothetical protein